MCKIRKILILVILSEALIGCTPLWNSRIQVDNLQISEGKIAIADKRPPSESEQLTFSWLATNCAFGIARVGDELFTPDRIRLLQHRAYEKFSPSSPKTIVVHHFVTYLNSQAASRTYGLVAGATGAGYVVINPQSINDAYGGSNFPSCEPKEVALGYYTKQEQPTVDAVAVVHIDAEIDGIRKYIRHAQASPSRFQSFGELLAVATENAIAKFLEKY